LTTAWFLDPTPASASEYTTLTNYTADLGGGTMNIGREYTGGTGNGAAHDLFTTAVHEIGHAPSTSISISRRLAHFPALPFPSSVPAAPT
jgi:hypothetical protein